MTMEAFPLGVNSQGWDSAIYLVTRENPALSLELEGGYTTSRRRFTRTPRRTFKIGWQIMLDTDRLILEAFWDARGGSGEMFTWVDPAAVVPVIESVPTPTLIPVRFKSKTPLAFKYVGRGSTKLWSVEIELEEV